MKLVVLVKQVPNVSQLALDPATRTLRRDGVRLEVSSFDVRALLRAVELRGELGGEVVVLTMGPPQARDALVHCLALGADRGVHLVDRAFAGADTLATARALALALRREGFDLVLCGRSSVDAETGQVGPEVAELLDLPQITNACRVTIDVPTQRLRAERETDDGFETVECTLPALVTAAEDLAPERFPRRAEKEAAQAKPIVELHAGDLSDDPSVFGAAGSPTRVEAIETVEERREGRVFEGELASAVEEIADTLVTRGLFAPPREAGAAGTPPRGREEGPGIAPAARSAGRLLGAAVPPTSCLLHGIWVVAETLRGAIRRVTLELLGKATTLAGESGTAVTAVLLGENVRRHTGMLGGYGAERVLVADDLRLAAYTTDAYAAVLAHLIAERKPGAILVPSTCFGRDLAPRVAARLGLGLTGDCIDLTLDGEGRLVQWKPAFGGSVVAPILSRTMPALATVRPGLLAPPTNVAGPPPEVEHVTLPALPPARVVVVGRRAAPGGERADALDEADVAIGVGIGLGGPEALPALEPLRAALGGAPLAATRDVTDKGWLSRQHQVGLTGRAIAPRFYFAIGIRGAFEHMVGLRRAGTIVAIDRNPKAPIFRQADLGLVADWSAAVPLLAGALAARRRA